MGWVAEAVNRLVAPFEGCHRLVNGLVFPYLDKLAKPPRWTRGYGMTEGITEATPPITLQQATVELARAVERYGLRCAAISPNLLKKPECLAAVASWAYNCGVGAYKVSRLRKAIDEERWSDAAELIRKPDTAGGVVYRGLVRRRAAERAMFLLGGE